MDRSDALAALIAKVEASERPDGQWQFVTRIWSDRDTRFAFEDAYLRDCLNGVARLERALRVWGWVHDGGCPAWPDSSQQSWYWKWWPPGWREESAPIFVRAPSEARVRLLACLKALHHEAAQ